MCFEKESDFQIDMALSALDLDAAQREVETLHNTQQTQAEIKCAAACSLQHGGICEVGEKCDQYKPFTSAVL